MKVEHKYMHTEALVKSYHIAHASRNWGLVEEIKQILTSRGQADKIPTKIAPVRVEQKPANSWNLDDW